MQYSSYVRSESAVKRQAGFSVTELLVVLIITGITVAIGALAVAPVLVRETMRSTLHDAGSLMSEARVEAIKRNRACRFVINPTARVMLVTDTQGTTSTSDDTILRTLGSRQT